MNAFNRKNGVDVEAEALRARPNRRTTPRLELIPLTLDEFALYLDDGAALAEKIRLAEPPSEPDAETFAALSWLFDEALALDVASLCWATVWLPILRNENRAVGFVSFKGPPRPLFDFLKTAPGFNVDVEIAALGVAKKRFDGGEATDVEIGSSAAPTGVVEIAYGVDKAFRNIGLATETVDALLNWGREREDVGAIFAETLTANLPSRRVLEKCGFRRCGESDDALLWRVDVSRRTGERRVL